MIGRHAAEEAERRAIVDALARTQGNRTRAAELLHVSRSTLWLKMQRYGIEGEPWRPAWGVAMAALVGCHRDVTPARDADAPRVAVDAPSDSAATHVCYGAANSAVEVPVTVRCSSIGASETPPAAVGPAARP